MSNMENKDLGIWQYMTLEPPPHIRELLERIHYFTIVSGEISANNPKQQ